MMYLEKPEHFTDVIESAGCHIVVGDEMLFLKRAPGKSYAHTWCVPAGKIEHGETTEDGVLREIREETGIVFTREDISFFRSVYVSDNTGNYVYHIFGAHLGTKPYVQVNAIEHTTYKWMTPQEALTQPLIEDEDAVLSLYFDL